VRLKANEEKIDLADNLAKQIEVLHKNEQNAAKWRMLP
jgi:hypothetical protein